MKHILSLILCAFCICANLSADEYGSFSLSQDQSPFIVAEGSSTFIPFSRPNKNEFQVACRHIIADPSKAEIKVNKKGVYLISYSASAAQNTIGGGSLEWNTVLIVNGTSLDNTTKVGATNSFSGSRSSATGQTIVFLPKHSVVQVKFTNTTLNPNEILDATIDFIEVD